jgi:hypothetical protein
MAHSIPTEITPDLAADPRRSAELLVRNRLSELLEDDVTVLYSVPWLHKESGGPPVEGEADFVIVHPDRGILVVRVAQRG